MKTENILENQSIYNNTNTISKFLTFEEQHFMLMYLREYAAGRLDVAPKRHALHRMDNIIKKFNSLLFRLVDTRKIVVLYNDFSRMPKEYEKQYTYSNKLHDDIDILIHKISELIDNNHTFNLASIFRELYKYYNPGFSSNFYYYNYFKEPSIDLYHYILTLDFNTESLSYKSTFKNLSIAHKQEKKFQLTARVNNLEDFIMSYCYEREYHEWFDDMGEGEYRGGKIYFDEYNGDEDLEPDGVDYELANADDLIDLLSDKKRFYYSMIEHDFNFCKEMGFKAYKCNTFDEYVDNWYNKYNRYDIERGYAGRHIIPLVKNFFREHLADDINDGDLSEIKWLKDWIKD